MQTENLKSFFVWFAATYRASRNRFSAISFHDYLHYFGIFLTHFLMKIDRDHETVPEMFKAGGGGRSQW